MARKVLWALLILIAATLLYLLLWPVPVDPVAWQAPASPGYTGPFAPNHRLTGLETFPLGDNIGPESVALDARGRIYAATHQGRIVRLEPDGSRPQNWVETGGRPLGIVFDNKGNLVVADAYRGLLSVSPGGEITELATEADGIPIAFADDLDVAADGKVYFSDASTRFGAQAFGGPMEASLLEILEHGGSGRLLVYDPETGQATTLLDGLTFANGVAVSPDQQSVLVNETGNYRILRYWIAGPKKGEYEVVVENLPSFPDNISAGRAGRFWVALVAPRNEAVDSLSGRPFVRKIVQRLPAFLRPKAEPFGHVIAIDSDGNVLADLQDPEGFYPIITSVIETPDYLYLGSLVTPVLGRLCTKDALGAVKSNEPHAP